MKKITILVLHLGYGGIEKYISSLCKMLENNFEIEIISTYKLDNKPVFFFSDKIKITYLSNDKPHKNELKESLKKLKILAFIKYSFKNLIILLKKKYKNIKVIKNIETDFIITTRTFHNKLVNKYSNKKITKIATEHNYHNNNKKYVNKLVKSLRNFNYLILVSEELQKFYEKKVSNTKCIYIPNVIEKVYDRPLYNTNHNIVSVGRLEYEKGFDDLIEIVALIKKNIPNIKLDLIGDGSLKKSLQIKIKNLALDKNIIMHGYLNQEEIGEIMLQSSVYVMTSHTESFGLVLIEAMAYGLPCVAFDSASGAKQVIENKDLLISNRDLNSMSDLIVNILSEPEKCKKFGQQSYQNCQKYLIYNVQKQWLRLLNNKIDF